MHKERSVNTYEGEIISENKVRFLNAEWECEPQTEFEAGQKVQVSVNFSSVDLIDHPEDGTLEGEVYFLLYKGNHYHLTVMTDHREYIWVDTNDIWDKGDLVGINIAPKDIKITKLDD
jgi:spermidine/putrescine transport system ATP-binding protein